MIKIESNKNFTTPKNNLGKATGDNSESENQCVAADSGEGGSNEFARVLENLTTAPKESADHKNESLKASEKDTRSKLDQHPKTEQTIKDKAHGTLNREDAAGALAARSNLNNNSTLEPELSVPPARAMMHIADLERIVSSLRTQVFQGNSQVVITLKNSVYSGLQIKLTTDQNHRVTAEFIAANEKVKAQIDARSGELADLLRQRGVKLANLQTSVGSETAGGNENQQRPENFESAKLSAIKTKDSQPENELIPETSETANTYRV